MSLKKSFYQNNFWREQWMNFHEWKLTSSQINFQFRLNNAICQLQHGHNLESPFHVLWMVPVKTKLSFHDSNQLNLQTNPTIMVVSHVIMYVGSEAAEVSSVVSSQYWHYSDIDTDSVQCMATIQFVWRTAVTLRTSVLLVCPMINKFDFTHLGKWP